MAAVHPHPTRLAQDSRTRRPVALAALAAGLLTPAGVAHAQQPTLLSDRRCYTEQQEMRFTGAGYTPGGEVNLIFSLPGNPRAGDTTRADAAGAIDHVTLVDDVDL